MLRLPRGRARGPPRDSTCIGLLAEGAEFTRCNIESFDEDEIQVYSPGIELMYHAAGPSRWGRRAYLRQLAYDSFGFAKMLQPAGVTPVLAREMSRAFVVAYVDALGTAEMVARTIKTSVDLSEIARRSGYSKRSLELIFRRSVGMTPGRWFMNVRLNGALRELLAPEAGCSVTDVATRWGFQHLSRFAEHYRRTFGELPSQTLARAVAFPRVR